ncbi:MAG: biotin transporter BioY [Oscillospiraceae bacterium]|nr:biotin transporter BioY [Oscillospiraceae bacterium]
MKYKNLTLTALYAAAMCVISPWVIPVGAVPITLASFGIYFIAGLTDIKKAIAAVSVYIMLGALGVPVFSGFAGGLQVLLGPTGGFIIGYLLATAIITILKDKIGLFSTICIATLAIYLVGTAWYMIVTKASFLISIVVCCLPFIVVDFIKIVLACILVPKLKHALKGA